MKGFPNFIHTFTKTKSRRTFVELIWNQQAFSSRSKSHKFISQNDDEHCWYAFLYRGCMLVCFILCSQGFVRAFFWRNMQKA